MACIYRKLRSPFWYVQFIDGDGRKHDKSTGLRTNDPNDTLKAKVLRAELEAEEYHRVPVVNHASELIHRIYEREKVEDVAQWRDAVRFPGSASSPC